MFDAERASSHRFFCLRLCKTWLNTNWFSYNLFLNVVFYCHRSFWSSAWKWGEKHEELTQVCLLQNPTFLSHFLLLILGKVREQHCRPASGPSHGLFPHFLLKPGRSVTIFPVMEKKKKEVKDAGKTRAALGNYVSSLLLLSEWTQYRRFAQTLKKYKNMISYVSYCYRQYISWQSDFERLERNKPDTALESDASQKLNGKVLEHYLSESRRPNVA